MYPFSVSYGTTVKLTTLIIGGALLGAAIYGLIKHRYGMTYTLGMAILPIGILLATFIFTVLGYQITEQGIYVLRPIGKKLIAPNKIKTVELDNDALNGATRTFGNAGMFSINGWFYLPEYGRSRLWVTDTNKLVVIQYDDKTVLVSPEDSVGFISKARSEYKL